MGEEGEGKYPRYQPDMLAKGPGVHREGVTFSSLLSETRVSIVGYTGRRTHHAAEHEQNGLWKAPIPSLSQAGHVGHMYKRVGCDVIRPVSR